MTTIPKSLPPAAPKASEAVPDKKATADNSVGSTIWQKLKPWDTDANGWLSERESADLFEAVGLPAAWAHVSAITTGVARGPLGQEFSHRIDAAKDVVGMVVDPEHAREHAKAFVRDSVKAVVDAVQFYTEGPLSVDLDHIGDARLKAQTGVFDERANADRAKVKAFIDGVTDAQGHATLASLKQHCERDAQRADGRNAPLRKYHFGEAYSAWVQLMEVAGNRAPGQEPYLTREQLESVYDGTMFDKILAKPTHNDVSVWNILRELLPATMKA